jgi:hypothetical protein
MMGALVKKIPSHADFSKGGRFLCNDRLFTKEKDWHLLVIVCKNGNN